MHDYICSSPQYKILTGLHVLCSSADTPEAYTILTLEIVVFEKRNLVSASIVREPTMVCEIWSSDITPLCRASGLLKYEEASVRKSGQ